jgi:ATP-binding cassette, subfamily D (ALD), member 4
MFLNICTYIRGKEEDNNYNKISIFKSFPLIFRLFFPLFLSVPTLVFGLLLIDVVALEFVVYQVGLLGGKFYKSLTDKNLDNFKDLAIISILLIILNSFMVSMRDFSAQLLSILWRKNITLELHKLYFEKKNYYYIQQKLLISNENSSDVLLLDHKSTNVLIEQDLVKNTLIDNPDQRITQDVNSLCKSFSTILPVLIISPFVICWYTYQAFLNIGYTGPLTVFVYFIVWSIINGPLTGPIARVIYKQDIKEGDFRC